MPLKGRPGPILIFSLQRAPLLCLVVATSLKIVMSSHFQEITSGKELVTAEPVSHPISLKSLGFERVYQRGNSFNSVEQSLIRHIERGEQMHRGQWALNNQIIELIEPFADSIG